MEWCSGLSNAIRNPEFQSAFLDVLSTVVFILMFEVWVIRRVIRWLLQLQDPCLCLRKGVEVDLCASGV